MKPINRRADRVALEDERTHEDGVVPASPSRGLGWSGPGFDWRIRKPLIPKLRSQLRRRYGNLALQAAHCIQEFRWDHKIEAGTDERHTWPLTAEEYAVADQHLPGGAWIPAHRRAPWRA